MKFFLDAISPTDPNAISELLFDREFQLVIIVTAVLIAAFAAAALFVFFTSKAAKKRAGRPSLEDKSENGSAKDNSGPTDGSGG